MFVLRMLGGATQTFVKGKATPLEEDWWHSHVEGMLVYAMQLYATSSTRFVY